ncbi:MAG: CoA pyrophosphatase [Desulfuromonadaceae bacterium]|nr:CoA pyrophosphatase [Desulfuromonadaceae bacterium]
MIQSIEKQSKDTIEHLTVARVEQGLQRCVPVMLESGPKHRDAAVALVLRDSAYGREHSPELLIIQRAHYHDDPWSGNLSFPGGKIDPDDRDAYAAAVRETREEVDIKLNPGHFLGQLDDIYAARVQVRVSAFVFNIPSSYKWVQGNYEVQRHFWVPLSHFLRPSHHAMRTICWHGDKSDVPSFFIDPDAPPLWGLTYRFVRQLLRHCGIKLKLK